MNIYNQSIYNQYLFPLSHLDIFTAVITNPNSPAPLRSTLLKLLGLILSCEGKRQKQRKPSEHPYNVHVAKKNKLTELLDRTHRSETDGNGGFFKERTPSEQTRLQGCVNTNQDDEQLETQGLTSAGAMLCKCLLAWFDRFGSKLQDNERKDKSLVKNCITGLLGLSKTAKHTAQNG